MVASAGADGVVNIWDLDRGQCFCTHKNLLKRGPGEPISRGKPCGYLEVQFSQDGFNLILTDENGRVTILDTLVPSYSRLRSQTNAAEAERYPMSSISLVTPAWMGEQYFANDYYDLVYDENGYCIERGSEQPPHLTPVGERCTHEGIPHPESMRNTYKELQGPLPLSNDSVQRNHIDRINFHLRTCNRSSSP